MKYYRKPYQIFLAVVLVIFGVLLIFAAFIVPPTLSSSVTTKYLGEKISAASVIDAAEKGLYVTGLLEVQLAQLCSSATQRADASGLLS